MLLLDPSVVVLPSDRICFVAVDRFLGEHPPLPTMASIRTEASNSCGWRRCADVPGNEDDFRRGVDFGDLLDDCRMRLRDGVASEDTLLLSSSPMLSVWFSGGGVLGVATRLCIASSRRDFTELTPLEAQPFPESLKEGGLVRDVGSTSVFVGGSLVAVFFPPVGGVSPLRFIERLDARFGTGTVGCVGVDGLRELVRLPPAPAVVDDDVFVEL